MPTTVSMRLIQGIVNDEVVESSRLLEKLPSLAREPPVVGATLFVREFHRSFILLACHLQEMSFCLRHTRPEYCAPFCAPSRRKTIANGSRGASIRIAATDAENQHHSESSHSVGKSSAATVNRRVASSNLARGAKLSSLVFNHLEKSAWGIIALK